MSIATAAAGASDLPDPIDSWLDEATRRLRVDPEIALEIRGELKSHFDDAVNELIRAGRTQSDAREEALRSLGDSKLLGQQLFKANRSRMKLRSLLLWSARLIMPAAALAMIAWIAFNAFVTFAAIDAMSGSWQFLGGRLVQEWRQRMITHAPADVKPLFDQEESPKRIASVQKYLDLHPTDPAAMFNLVQTCVVMADDKPLDEKVKILHDAQKIEPCNGFYDLMLASALLNSSATDVSEQPEDKNAPWKPMPFKIESEKGAEETVAAFHRAAVAPMFKTYSVDLLSRKEAFLPSAGVADICLRLCEEVSTLLPHLNHVRYTADFVSTRAALTKNKQLAADIHSVARKMAADAQTAVELLVAVGIDNLASKTDEYIAKTSGDNVAASHAADREKQLTALARSSRKSAQPTGEEERGGMIMGDILRSPLPAGRWMEYDLADATVLAIIAACFIGLAAAYGSASLVSRWRSRSDLRLILSASDVIKIVGIGLVLPVALFLTYSRYLPINARDLGILRNAPRTAVEYIILLAVIVLSVNLLSRRAIRRRAKALGAELPRYKFSVRAIVLTISSLIGLAAIVFAVAAAAGNVPNFFGGWQNHIFCQAVLLSIGWTILLYVPVKLYRDGKKRPPSAPDPISGTIARSMLLPCAISAVILVLLTIPLRFAEMREVHSILNGNQTIWLGREVEQPAYADLKKFLAL